MNNRRRTSLRREQLERLYRTDSNYDDYEFDYEEDEDDRAPYYDAPRTRGYREDGRRYRDRERYYDRRESSKDRSGTHRENSLNWYTCRPVFIGCAVTCLITAGLTKNDIGSWLSDTTDTAKLQAASLLPKAVNAPVTSATDYSRVPGLSASRSTITGFTDAASMSAAYYWTFTLTNSGQTQQEARMRIAVPPGATVSRATLWVNGVAQEAAFSTTSQVNRAYEWVRNGRQPIPRPLMHDPLVITQESPGHILVKAAPVEAGGQELKLRIGFTAPLRPTAGNADLHLPHIEDSNFSIGGLQDVHLESVTSVSANESAVSSVNNPAGGFLLRGNIRPEELGSLKVNVDLHGATKLFATRATHSGPGNYILASINESTNGQSSISLRKTTVLPNSYRLIRSEPAAARLSALWAHAEIESLVKRGHDWEANELARVHRIVSSVSGATVLELDSDYSTMGLNRDLYATSRIGISRGAAPGAGEGAGADMVISAFQGADKRASRKAERQFSAPMQPAPSASQLSDISFIAEAPAPREETRSAQRGKNDTTEQAKTKSPVPMPTPKVQSAPVPPETVDSAENDVDIVFSEATATTPKPAIQNNAQNSALLIGAGIVASLLAGFLLLKVRGRALWSKMLPGGKTA